MEGTDILAQEGIEPRTVCDTSTLHACSLASSSPSYIYGHIQSILSTDPLDTHENLHENDRTIDENIWSILSDCPVADARVFAALTPATKSRVKFCDNVEHFTVVPYSEVYGVHPKILFPGKTRMTQKIGVCKWTGKSHAKLCKRVMVRTMDSHAISRHRTKWIEIGNQSLLKSLKLVAGTLTHPCSRGALSPDPLQSTSFASPPPTSSGPTHSQSSWTGNSCRAEKDRRTSAHEHHPSSHGGALQKANEADPLFIGSGASQRAAARSLNGHYQSDGDTKAKSDVLLN